MVMPYCAHRLPTELTHQRIIRLVNWQGRTHKSKFRTRPFPELEIIHSPTCKQVSNLMAPIHTPLQIQWVTEVVKPHNGVGSHINRCQPKLTRRMRPNNLLHDAPHHPNWCIIA
ncbi:hypothetical protein Hdeb2414_s0005g00186381 [Helianthus debilis subsp. tardiflorus]